MKKHTGGGGGGFATLLRVVKLLAVKLHRLTSRASSSARAWVCTATTRSAYDEARDVVTQKLSEN